MTTELTKIATELETYMDQMLTEGMDFEHVWGFSVGFRHALNTRGLLGDLEDEALSRHLEPWFAKRRPGG